MKDTDEVIRAAGSANSPRNSFNGYLQKLRMTNKAVLLVEGSDDKQAFKQLFNHIIKDRSSPPPYVIDTAEMFGSPENQSLGNREKIEAVVSRSRSYDLAGKLTAFVDREYRNFAIDECILDQSPEHEVDDCLVRSRGHSIENYFLHTPNLIHVLNILCRTDCYDDAMQCFEQCFSSTIRLAATIGLVAHRLQRTSMIQGSIDWKILQIDGKEVIINLEDWQKLLGKKLKCDEETCRSIISTFQKLMPIVSSSEPEVLRWVCHGHITMSVIWAIFARCVYQISKDASEAESLYSVDNRVRFDLCSHFWASLAVIDKAIFPELLLARLSFISE